MWGRDEKWRVRTDVCCPLMGKAASSPVLGLLCRLGEGLVYLCFWYQVGGSLWILWCGFLCMIITEFLQRWVSLESQMSSFSFVPVFLIKCGLHGSDSLWFFTLSKYALTFKINPCVRARKPEVSFLSVPGKCWIRVIFVNKVLKSGAVSLK